jgi:hypothetical protein
MKSIEICMMKYCKHGGNEPIQYPCMICSHIWSAHIIKDRFIKEGENEP